MLLCNSNQNLDNTPTKGEDLFIVFGDKATRDEVLKDILERFDRFAEVDQDTAPHLRPMHRFHAGPTVVLRDVSPVERAVIEQLIAGKGEIKTMRGILDKIKRDKPPRD